MSWWSVVKSSRGEAYSVFLEEFGPGVKLQEVSISPMNEDLSPSLRTPPKLYGSSFVLRIDERGGLKIAGQSSKYTPYTEFVIGMFLQEYPERYKEILDMFTEVDGNQGVPLPIIGEYYELLEDVMKSLRERIRHFHAPTSDYKREALPLMLRATSLFYISPDSNFIAQKLNTNTKWSKIIYYITVNMVDRMIRDIPMLRDQNNASLSLVSTDGKSTALRESLIDRYFGLFVEAIGLNPDGSPTRVVNLAVNDRVEEVIRYLNKQVKAYLGEES